MTRHQNPEVEAAVVGALLDATGRVVRSDVATLLATSALAPADFTAPFWRAAFQAIEAISERRGEVSPLAVWAAIRGRKGVPEDGHLQLEAAQGGNVLAKDAMLQQAATLRRLTVLRDICEFHARQLQRLEASDASPDTAAMALEEFSRGLATASAGDETGESDVISLLDSWEAASRGEYDPLMPTGIALLDEHVGGWERNLNLVGGLPSVGKSALIATIIGNQLKAGRKVGLFGLEEGTLWLLKRLVARDTGLELRAVGRARLTDTQQEAVTESMGAWHERFRNLHVYRRGGIKTSELVAISKRWVAAHGVECIYVDHGGEVSHESSAGSRDRHDLATASTYRAMRNLALNHSVPVVMLAHFSREAYGQRPILGHFAHTEEVGRMASTALGLWEDRERLLCEVVKARNGKRGTTLHLTRHASAGLVSSTAGEVIDVDREHAEAREQSRSLRRNRAGAF